RLLRHGREPRAGDDGLAADPPQRLAPRRELAAHAEAEARRGVVASRARARRRGAGGAVANRAAVGHLRALRRDPRRRHPRARRDRRQPLITPKNTKCATAMTTAPPMTLPIAAHGMAGTCCASPPRCTRRKPFSFVSLTIALDPATQRPNAVTVSPGAMIFSITSAVSGSEPPPSPTFQSFRSGGAVVCTLIIVFTVPMTPDSSSNGVLAM